MAWFNNVVDSIPIVGHVKGAIHYACGDNEAGDRAEKAASRTVAVAAGGAGGLLVGGPAGAFAGGVAGGLAHDGLVAGIEQAAYGHPEPSESLKAAGRVASLQGSTHDIENLSMDGVAGASFGTGKIGAGLATQLRK